ncbi:putative secreted protein with PEP-CTERM sorting signal [Marinimicrobium koreense]|uniref:Putative secreted protein with PEP-CTERM sorting signal n=1 Tax=Marinimicrobium koreense TaxID=306545 RepID=A0A3N1NZX1_9GAMM|nr:PEP-CTERM sorting domain-containing protein [Marinimicrobium koreense]ROQ21755.1 putative secreted protein with PEP-CTERM sorting signal [Marinimicrobium koreense]
MNILSKGFRVALATVIVAFASHAQALLLGPGDADWTSNSTSNLNGTQVADIVGTSSILELYYKKDVDDGKESGSFTTSYNAAFSGDPNNALITYVGGASIICPECYLIVKNGKQPQYLFNLADWDGLESLDLQGFYPKKGAISNVAIWGKTGVSVPEPSALILMGLGLIGLGMARRRVAR